MRNLITAFIAAAFVVLLSMGGALAQATSAPRHYLSTATNNATLVYTAANGVRLNGGVATNTNATIYYLKFYNKATQPVCGTDTPVWTIPLPQNVPAIIPDTSAIFPLGLGFCITANIADNDNTSAAAGIAVNLGISGR